MHKKKTYFRPEDFSDTNHLAFRIKEAFKNKIEADEYPCVGAKSAMNTDQFRFGIYQDMGSPSTTSSLANDLQKYLQETIAADSQYMSMIAVFSDRVDTELEFEKRLWAQLQALHDGESGDQVWDPAVSDDPESSNFSFSFHGQAFFVVGLHPHASRKARRFDECALAFNLHRQFEQLRDKEGYERMKAVIREREIAYQGSINPMLRDHGAGLEAPQYSGRAVGPDWKCPFLSKIRD